MHHYMMNELVPKVGRKVREGINLSQSQILKQYKLSKLCIRTVYDWMDLVIFKLNVRRKTYYCYTQRYTYKNIMKIYIKSLFTRHIYY